MSKRALLIGINYTSVPGSTLNGCVDDVVNMANVLMSHYGYAASDIVILRDDATMLSLQPTYRNIMANLAALAAASASCSEVWLHYSGHGSRVVVGAGVSEDVIIPVDFQRAGIVLADDVNAFIRRIARPCRAMVLMDCCHSGSLCELEWSFQYVSGNTFRRTRSANGSSIANPNVMYISGSLDDQTADDMYDTVAKQYEGAFTNAFLTTLQQNNYTVSIGRLIQGIYAWLSAHHFSQTPLFSSSTATPAFTLTDVAPVNPVALLPTPVPVKAILRGYFRDVLAAGGEVPVPVAVAAVAAVADVWMPAHRLLRTSMMRVILLEVLRTGTP